MDAWTFCVFLQETARIVHLDLAIAYCLRILVLVTLSLTPFQVVLQMPGSQTETGTSKKRRRKAKGQKYADIRAKEVRYKVFRYVDR